MSSPSASSVKSPLDAAQKIVTELTGMTSENQLLALKFANETLGLQLPAPLSPAGTFRSHATPDTTAHGKRRRSLD